MIYSNKATLKGQKSYDIVIMFVADQKFKIDSLHLLSAKSDLPLQQSVTNCKS